MMSRNHGRKRAQRELLPFVQVLGSIPTGFGETGFHRDDFGRPARIVEKEKSAATNADGGNRTGVRDSTAASEQTQREGTAVENVAENITEMESEGGIFVDEDQDHYVQPMVDGANGFSIKDKVQPKRRGNIITSGNGQVGGPYKYYGSFDDSPSKRHAGLASYVSTEHTPNYGFVAGQDNRPSASDAGTHGGIRYSVQNNNNTRTSYHLNQGNGYGGQPLRNQQYQGYAQRAIPVQVQPYQGNVQARHISEISIMELMTLGSQKAECDIADLVLVGTEGKRAVTTPFCDIITW
jgi:hypothetical protein